VGIILVLGEEWDFLHVQRVEDPSFPASESLYIHISVIPVSRDSLEIRVSCHTGISLGVALVNRYYNLFVYPTFMDMMTMIMSVG
jgi:hypothetical protein